MLRSPSKFKIPTLDPSAKDTSQPCRVAHKHPWLIVHEWNTLSNMRINCLQFQTAGAGKYTIIARTGSLSNDTTPHYLSIISPLNPQTSLSSYPSGLMPSLTPFPPSSNIPHLSSQCHHHSSQTFTLASGSHRSRISTYRPYLVPPPFQRTTVWNLPITPSPSP